MALRKNPFFDGGKICKVLFLYERGDFLSKGTFTKPPAPYENEKDHPILPDRMAPAALFGLSSECVCNVSDVCTSNETDYTMVLSRLQDEVSSKFEPKKKSSCALSEVYFDLDLKSRSFRVSDCGTFLEYYVTKDQKKLHNANFCKDRLCPMCNWRRSLKIYGQVSQVMDYLERDNYRFLFLTLTVKNCSAEDLSCTVQALYDGWRYMYNKSPVFKSVIAGTFRCLEVTRNKKTGEFHPHIHVILAVRPDYFKKKYLTQAQWQALWRKSCNLAYDPIIDIRVIKPGPNGLSGAVAEVSKYAVKDSDFLFGTQDEKLSYVSAFLNALTARRLISFTGCFNKVRKLLNLDDAETGDLVHVDDDTLREDVATMIVRYGWRNGVYVRI